MDTTLPLEIVVRILDCLPGRCLKVCRCVCKSWKEASDIILAKKGRQNLHAASFIGQLKCPKFLTVVKNFFNFTSLPIHAVVILIQASKSAQGDRRLCQILQDAAKCISQEDKNERSVLPLIGCVVKFSFGPMLNNWEDLINTLDIVSDIPNTTSVLLFPQLKSYHISTFHIPMKKKYEMIKGYASFLPTIQSRTSLVILFIHPVTLGRMTHFVKTVRRVYGPETCIIGLYSESCLFNEELVTSNEIIGMSLSGDLISFSSVISDEAEAEDRKLHVSMLCNRVEETAKVRDYCMLIFIFASNSFGNGKALNVLAQVRRKFPNALVFGAYSPSVFGADYNINDSKKLPGGRDYLQTKGAILCFLLIKRSGAFA